MKIQEMEITVHGKNILLAGEHNIQLSESVAFINWLSTFDPDFNIIWISEEWSFWRMNGQVVFAIFLVSYIDETSKEKRSLFFFRADSAAVLLILRDKNDKKFIVFVEQIRGPVGGKILEIPAGTLEEGESSALTMAREIEEETGLKIRAEELKLLGIYYFSPGACTEQITLYYCEKNLAGPDIKKMQDRLAGLREHGENIKVKIYSFDEFENLKIRDAKTQLTYMLYQKHVEKNK